MKKKLVLPLLFCVMVFTSLFGQVEPMIQSQWNTDGPWNGQCPVIQSTRVDAGSGALATAKIMKFWNYPSIGNGTAIYYDDDLGNINQNLQVSFDWERMSNILNRPETQALIAIAGYAIESDWEIDYTTSNLEDIQDALQNNFSYSDSMELHDLASTSIFDWRQMINQQLALGRPVLYQGYAPSVDRYYQIIIDGLNADNRYTYVTSIGNYEHYTTNLTDLIIDGHLINVNNQKMLINIIPSNLNEYDESFESGFTNNNWYFQGNAGWTIASNEAYEGTHSARPLFINHNQTSSMLIDLEVAENDNISFFIKPSCEYLTIGQYDRAVFYINGVEQDEWFGEGEWTYASYALTPGIYQFKWSYIKDGSVVGGDDTIYLDAIDLPEGQTPLNPPQNLTAQITQSNTVTLNWDFPAGYQRDLQGYIIYKDYSELTRSYNPNVISYTDGNVSNGVHYYSVKAIYNTGVSSFSNIATVELSIFYPPTNLSYNQVNENTVEVTWSPSPLVGDITPDSYNIYLNGNFHSSSVNPQLNLSLSEGEHLLYVTAMYSGTESSPSSSLRIVIGSIAPPSNLIASVYDNDNVHLVWTVPSSDYATGYEIYRNDELLTVLTNESTNFYNDENLENGAYVYKIRTVYYSLTSGFSLPASVNIMNVEAPINLVSSIINEVSVQLSWSYGLGADLIEYYKVYRDNQIVASVYNISNPTFFDYNLANGSYEYQVTAVYDGIESDFSETEIVVINYPYPPRNLSADIQANNVNLSWDLPAIQGGPSRDLIGYKVYKNGQIISNIYNTGITNYTVFNLENSSYTFGLQALYNSGLSEIVEVEVDIEILYPPYDLAYTLDGNSVSLDWQADSNSGTNLLYRIYRNGSEYANTSETSFTDENLNNGYYEYSVATEYPSGLSEQTSPISFELEILYPVTTFNYEISGNDIILDWERPTLADNERSLIEYELFRNDISIANTTDLSYTDSDLVNGSYEYYVLVHYSSGTSQSSEIQDISLIINYPIAELTSQVENKNNINLNWYRDYNSGDTIENFQVLRNGMLIDTINETSYTDSDLADGSYTYSIIASYINGDSQPVNSDEIQIEYPYLINNLQAIVSDDDINLSWEYPYSGNPIFKIYRNGSYLSQTNQVSFTDEGLANGDYSYYIITSNNSDSGDSEASNAVSAEVSVTYPVTGLEANVINNSIELTWTRPAIASRAFSAYSLYVNDSLEQAEINQESFTLTDLANGTYSIYVIANYTNGDSQPSNIVNPYVEVAYSPVNITVTNQDNNVELAWEAPIDQLGLSSYSIYRNASFLAETSDLTYNDNALINDTYTYAIRANYTNGQSAPLVSEDLLIDLHYPITNLAVEVDNSNYTLSWQANPLAGSSILEYNIYMADELLATSSDTSYLFTDNPNGRYDLAVKAIYETGESDLSEEVEAVIDVHYPVHNLTGSVEGNVVTLTWDINSLANNVLEYNILKDSELIATSSEEVFIDSNLANGQYNYQVQAVYVNALSDLSSPLPVQVEVLYEPNNLTLSLQDNNVNLTWDEPNEMYRGFLAYKVFKNDQLISSQTQLTYSDSDLVNGTYSYYVKAEYSSGDSQASNAVEADIEVLYPANNLVLDINEDDVLVSWSPNPMAANSILDFTIYRNNQELTRVNSLSYLDQALANGSYDYYIVANYQSGSSVASQIITGQVEVPYSPENFTYNVEGNNVLLTWDAAPTSSRSFLGYKVYRDEEEIFFDASALSYYDENLINDTYDYKLEAIYSTGISQALYANVVVEVLYPLVNFTGQLNDTEITLTWDVNENVGQSILSYSLYRNGDLYANLTDLSYIDSGLANGSYEYYVIADYASASSAASQVLDFNVEITYPVTNLTGQVTDDYVDLAWNMPANSPRALLGYNIYRNDEVIAETQDLTYRDLALANGNYSYYVTALYDAGESQASNSVDLLVEVLYPVENLLASVDSSDVILSWAEIITYPRSFLNYVIYRDEEEIAQVNDLTYTDENLANGSYNYYVKANYTTGISQASNNAEALVEVLYPAQDLLLSVFEDDISLSWNENIMSASSIIDFSIFRNGQDIASSIENEFLDQALANGNYEYSIKVNYQSGSSELCPAQSALVEVPYSPENFTYNVEGNNVLLTWDAAPTSSRSFLGYKVYRDEEEIFFDASALSYYDENLINATYDYKLEAIYSTGISQALYANVVVEVLYPLVNFTGQLNDTEITLTWDVNENVGQSILSYSLYRNGDLYANLTDLSYIDSGLANGSYEYYVIADYASASSAASQVLDFNVEITYPVTNLTGQVTDDYVDLAWNMPANSPRALLGYNIYRNDEVIAETQDLTYRDLALANGNYSYYVTALYDAGESQASNSVDLLVEVLYPVENLLVSVDSSNVILSWDEIITYPRSFLNYVIYRDEEEIAQVNDLTYTDENLANGSYNYYVKANYTSGLSPASNDVEAFVEVFYPAHTLVGSLDRDEISLNWQAPVSEARGLIGYNIYRNDQFIASSNDLSYVDSFLANGSYNYYVTAAYSGGESIPTNTLDFEIEITYPASSLIAQVEDNNVSLTWELPATSAQIRAFRGYLIYRNGAIATLIDNPQTLTWTDYALANGD
jgi:hypothetical protein